MKKIVCLILFTVFSACLLCQEITPAVVVPDDYYLEKSKKQRTAGYVLLSGGAVLIVLSLIIPPGKREIDDIFLQQKVYTPRYVAFFTGVGAMAGSIPLFIASGKNRKRAFGITGHLKIENAATLQRSARVNTYYPALGIKISL